MYDYKLKRSYDIVMISNNIMSLFIKSDLSLTSLVLIIIYVVPKDTYFFFNLRKKTNTFPKEIDFVCQLRNRYYYTLYLSTI